MNYSELDNAAYNKEIFELIKATEGAYCSKKVDWCKGFRKKIHNMVEIRGLKIVNQSSAPVSYTFLGFQWFFRVDYVN